MGAGGSKHPGWYPGEPDAALFSFRGCQCGRDENPNDGAASGVGELADDDSSSGGNRGAAVATSGTNGERTIESLPVVELTDWEFVANGTFCSVFSCKYRGFDVVAKRVRLDMSRHERRDALHNLWNEYECLRRLRHPNIIDVYGMCRRKRDDNGTPWEEADVCLVVERLALGTMGYLLGTTLTPKMTDTIARNSRMKMLPLRRRLDRVLELAIALEYLHGHSGLGPMMHRDLKSVNVGFAMNGRLKLIDFGLAKMIPDPDANETDTYEMTGGVGSLRYMAPEIVKQEPYNTTADIYSWAVLSWEIIAMKRPYSDVSETTFYKRVVFDGERPPLKKRWPKQLRDLLASAWDPDLRKRPTAKTTVMTLRVLRAELVARENSRSSSRARSKTDADGGDEGQQTKRFVNSAPSTISGDRPDLVGKGDNDDEDSDESFSAQSMRTSSTRRHFSLRTWRSPRIPPPSYSEKKKHARSFLGVGGKGASADAAAARSDRDAGTTRTISLSCAVLEDEDGAGALRRGRRNNSYPTNFSHPISETSQVLEGKQDYVEGPTLSLAAENPCPNGICPIHHAMFDLRDDLIKQLSKEREGLVEQSLDDSDEVSEGPATGSSGRTFHDANVDFTRKLKEGRIKTNQAPEDAKETNMDHAAEAPTDAVGRESTTGGDKNHTPLPSFFKRARNGDTVDSVAACAQVLEKVLDNSARSPRWGSGDKLTGDETPPTTSCSRSSMLMPDLGKPASPNGAQESPNGHLRGDGVREARIRY